MGSPRLIYVTLGTLAGMGLVVFVPSEAELRPAAMTMELPAEARGWYGEAVAPSAEEKKILAEDTEFSKRTYHRFRPETLTEQMKGVSATIVLSGHDLSNSIHRPERCLEAQGFKGLQVENVDLDLGNGESLTVRRVRSHRNIRTIDGGTLQIEHLTYYWFVGSDIVTESHYRRHLVDMKDRLFGGFNQRWAYFNISSSITSGLERFGARDEAETDALLQDFVREIYFECVDHAAVGRLPKNG